LKSSLKKTLLKRRQMVLVSIQTLVTVGINRRIRKEQTQVTTSSTLSRKPIKQE